MSISKLTIKPTDKELGRKLEIARRLLTKPYSRVIIIDRYKWDEEWERLAKLLGLKASEWELKEQKFERAAEFLAEITPHDHRWRGQRVYCDRPGFHEVELWEFIWRTTNGGKALYVKFGIKKVGRGGREKEELLCFLSLHPDEPERTILKREAK